MKRLLVISVFLTVIGFHKSNAQDAFKQALDSFHNVLAFTYHPMTDENNFSPIRNRNNELASKAEALVTAAGSTKEMHEETDELVEQLADQCETLSEIIRKNATDDEIRAGLSKIHDTFHELEDSYSRRSPEK